MIFENLEKLVNGRYKLFLVIFTLLLGASQIGAAQNYGSEDELKKQAQELFEQQRFVEAMPLFSQLVSLYPADPNLNYKYGACLIHGDADKGKSLKYLRFAVSKSNVEPKAYYFLARALHLNYEFDQAILNYKKFNTGLSSKEKKLYLVEQEIQRCESGKKLIRELNEVAVLGKQEIKRSDFFRVYDLEEIGGKIIVKPDEFKTKYDQKVNEYSLIHLPPNPTVLYYASYGDNNSNGKDIFRVRKLENGEWSEPENLGAPINTPFDEDFPFMHSDGKTLYFSSKGHNSMGGFDIFKAEYNEATGTWSAPSNLDFAVSSTGDDILFISNLENDIAYFASSRYSLDEFIAVYKVLITRNPIELSVIRGQFISESNPAKKGAKITVMDADNNENMGIFITDNNTGEYTIKLPKRGGTYKFILETTSSAPIHTGKVTIPSLDQFRTLKQELRLVGSGDNEKLVIKNLFDQRDDEGLSPDLIADMLRKKARLDVNTTDEAAARALAKSKTEASLVLDEQTPGSASGTDYSSMSNDQLLADLQTELKAMERDVKQLQERASFTYAHTNRIAQRADEIYTLNDNLLDNLDGTETEAERQEVMRKVKENKREANPLASEAIAGYSLAGSLENEAKEKKQELRSINESIALLRSKINAGNRAEALEIFIAGKENIEDVKKTASTFEIEPSRKKEQLREKQAEAEKVRNYYNDLKKEQTDLENEIIRNKEEVKTLKGKKQEALQNQINAFELDLQDIGFEAENIGKKARQLEEEAMFQEKELELTKKLIEKIKVNTTVEKPLDASEKLNLEKIIAYFREQNLLDDILGDESTELVVDNAGRNPVGNSSPLPAFDEAGNSLDYDAKYEAEKQAALKIEDPDLRQAALVDIHENWAKTLAADLNRKREMLKSTNDATLRENLQKEIEAIEQSVFDKEDAALAYAGSAESDEPSSTTLTVDETTFSEGIPIPPVSANGEPLDYDAIYIEKLNNLQVQGASPAELAEVNALWSRSIEADIGIRKQQLKQEKDKARKAELNQEIAALSEKMKAKRAAASGQTPSAPIAEETKAAGSENRVPDYTSLSNNPEKIVDENGQVVNYNATYASAMQQARQTQDNAKIGAIATQWSASTQAEIVVHRKALEQEVNQEKREDLYAQIAALTLINDQRSNAIQQGTEQVGFDEEKQAYLNLLKTPAAIQGASGILNYDQFYTNAIKLAEERKDNDQVMTLTANWEASRNAHIAIAKAELENTGSEQERDQLYKLIAALEAMNGAKSASSASQQQDISATKPTSSVAGTVSTFDQPLPALDEQGTVNDYGSAYEAWIQETEKKEDPYEKTSQLVKIHQNWATSIATEIRHKEQVQTETAKKKEKKAIAEDIAQLKTLQQQQLQKAKDYQTQLASMPQPRQDKKEAQLAMYQHEKLAVKYDLIDYHYEGAEADMKEVGELIMEVISIEAEITRKQELLDASENNFERERLMNDIKTLEKRSGELQLTISSIFAKADEKEFTFQRQRLENAPQKGSDQEELVVDSIVLLAQAQYNEAQARRKVAAGASSFSEQKSLLQQAFELERMAFQTQRKAFEIREDELIIGKEDEKEEPLATAETITQPGESTAADNQQTPIKNTNDSPETTFVQENEIVEDTSETNTAAVDLAVEAKEQASKPLRLTQAEVEQIESNEQFVAYSEKQEEISRLAKEAEVTYSKASTLEKEAEALKTAAEQRREEAKGIRKKKQRKLVLEEASRMELEAEVLKSRADSTLLVAEQLDNDAEAKRSDSEESLRSVDDEALFQRLLAYYQAKLNGLLEIRKEQRLFTSSEPDESTVSVPAVAEVEPEVFEQLDFTQLPEVIEQDVFVKAKAKSVSAYSAAKPIPIDKVSLPEGVVFKVQIGAFRNPIPQDLFKGFAPVNGERTSSGITRYTAGIFKQFSSADQAKVEIRNLGYTDAFVVAFRNGKRIPISEALALLGEGGANAVTERTSTGGATEERAAIAEQINTTSAGGDNAVNGELIAEAQDVQQIAGLFYTVQVGVYSNERVPEQLAGIRPLNSERTAQGYIRYTSGVYPTFEEAVARRRELVAQGVGDAFITAYSNGKRISIGEARKLNK